MLVVLQEGDFEISRGHVSNIGTLKITYGPSFHVYIPFQQKNTPFNFWALQLSVPSFHVRSRFFPIGKNTHPATPRHRNAWLRQLDLRKVDFVQSHHSLPDLLRTNDQYSRVFHTKKRPKWTKKRSGFLIFLTMPFFLIFYLLIFYFQGFQTNCFFLGRNG